MATPPFSLSTLHSLVKQEVLSDSPAPMQPQYSPALPSISEAPSVVKVEPMELSVVSRHQEAAQQPTESQFLQSIDQLTNLSSVINEFYRRFDDLRKHLDFIQTSIDARSNGRQNIQATAVAAVTEAVPAATMPESGLGPPKSEVTALCEMMSGRGLRKYLTSNLSRIKELREEVPSALQCAPQPAKLVLECFGRFYLQGIRAYAKKSPMITGRRASILILEFFLLMMDENTQFDSDVKQEAEQAAIAWRQRLVAEGGISKAGEADARGLLLFLGCYGIPKVFSDENIWDLIRLSNSKKITVAVKRSQGLVNRVADIIERMIDSSVKLEAIDVTRTFGLEERIPPQKIVTAYLRDSREAMKRKTREANNSPVLLKEASEKQLATLKSVVKFLEDRNFDPVKLASGWQIKEKMESLEKEVADLRAAAKRKADEQKTHEAKRLKFMTSPVASSPNLGLHEQRAPYHLDSNGLYSGNPMRLNLPDGGGFSGHISNPDVGSIMRGPSSYSAAYGGVPSASSYARSRAELLVDRYGRHGAGDASISYAYQPTSGLYTPSALVKGFGGLPSSSPTPANRSSGGDLYGFADAVN